MHMDSLYYAVDCFPLIGSNILEAWKGGLTEIVEVAELRYPQLYLGMHT